MKLIDKCKTKQFGVLLIIVGAFIPSILYPFTSLTTSATLAKAIYAVNGVSYDTSLHDVEIVLVKGDWKKDSKNSGGHYEGRLALPYRYTLAFGILLSFLGIGFVALYKNKRESDTGAHEMQPISQNQPNKTNRSWLIGTPMYCVSWIALIGSVSAIFLGQNAPQGGLALSFWCGAITAITAKRKNKSGWLWFFIGLIPIGFSLFFMIVFLKTLFLRH